MKLAIKNASSIFMIVSSMATVTSAQTRDPLPSAEDVVAKMMQLDAQRHSELTGDTAIRRYVAVNKSRRAEMLVRIQCASDGAKEFTILSEQGSGSIRKRVFHKLLSEETEASRRGMRSSTRLTPSNYDFEVIGQEMLETRPVYVLAVSPKTA